MEALIILIVEFLAVPVVAGVTFLAQFVVSVVGFIFELIFGVAMGARSKEQKCRWTVPPRVVKWGVRLSLYSLSACIALLLLVNYVFFAQTVRFVADRVETNTGIQIQFDEVTGNLFDGAFAFSELELDQDAAGEASFYIQAQSVEVDLSISDLLVGKRIIQTAALSNAIIEYETLPVTKREEESRPFHIGAAVSINESGLDGAAITTRSKMSATPKFTIENLSLEEVNVSVTDRSAVAPVSYEILINHFDASPIRSHFVIFDLLFRSNLDGSLNGSGLTIINTKDDGLRGTQWQTQDVPASILSSMVGGPFSLFDGGMIDVTIHDQWNVGEVDHVMLDWEIVVRDAHAQLPSSIPSPLRPLAQVWVDNINENQKQWEFGFELELSEAQFYGATTLNTNQIWEGSIPVVLKQVSGLTNIDETTLKEKTSQGFNAFKGFLERRKNKE